MKMKENSANLVWALGHCFFKKQIMSFFWKQNRKILDKFFFLVLMQLVLLMFWENLQIFSITKTYFNKGNFLIHTFFG
jgi:hypothetical protein